MSKYESLVVAVVAQIRRNSYTESRFHSFSTNCFLCWIPPRVRIAYGAYSEAMHNDQSEDNANTDCFLLYLKSRIHSCVFLYLASTVQ